jgi:hypothetical protein
MPIQHGGNPRTTNACPKSSEEGRVETNFFQDRKEETVPDSVEGIFHINLNYHALISSIVDKMYGFLY